MNILEQLREAEHFSSAEQNIIRYLLQYPETIINFSVRDLAKASYTSPSTVTRLVKKLDDGHGFSHFKARFFSEINSVFLASGDRTINTNETVHSIVQKIADLEQTAIEQTKQSIDYQTLVRAANLINSCSQLEKKRERCIGKCFRKNFYGAGLPPRIRWRAHGTRTEKGRPHRIYAQEAPDINRNESP